MKGKNMATIKYKLEDMPPMTPEDIKTLQNLPNDEVDCSDMPELDELDFKYSIPGKVFMALSTKEKRELGRKLHAAEQAERAALKAQREARQTAELIIAEARQLAHQA
jgi:hypothetical protein